jgi:CheY-like chemotaxis protein
MTLSALLVCSDKASEQVLNRVLEDLSIRVELCPDFARAAFRLAQERFDVVIVDGESSGDVTALLAETRQSRVNDGILAVAVVRSQESIRELFSLGVNFVLYKPVAYDRALSSLRAARAVMRKEKRKAARASVHAHATVEYANVQQEKATLIDLGHDGMAVTFGKKLPPTSKVYFQFQLPGQKGTVRLSGQVVWQEINGRAGVSFVNVPQSSRKLLTEWLRANLEPGSNDQLAAGLVNVEHSTQQGEELVAVGEIRNGKTGDGKVHDRAAVARLRSEPYNRRGPTRYSCRLGAEVFLSGSSVRNYCHLSDLSPGGCYLEMPLVFPAGSPVEITVRTHEMKLRLSGQVKASHPGYGMGIFFKLNTQEERQGVQQLIDFVASTNPTEPE